MSNGWDEKTGLTDHAALMKYVSKMTPDQLAYVRKDARGAAEAQPSGKKAGYYRDLELYCAMRQVVLRESLPC